jgi:sec-independent protein translocase protein TatA
MSLGAPEIILIILAVLLLFGYKKLPDASRSIGRSLRIFKGEMKGLKDDDVRAKEPATTSAVRGEVVPPTSGPTSGTAGDGDVAARLAEEARAAEARAAELRARAEQARAAAATGSPAAPTASAPTASAPAAEGPR